MKTLLPILFLWISISSSTAQLPYTPFEFETSIWDQFQYSLWFEQDFYDVKVVGDTMINNIEYHKLQVEGMAYFYEDNQFEITDSMVIDYYGGAIRENDQKQVFLVHPTDLEESILFDFNLMVGDTVDLLGTGDPQDIAVVTSIDSIEVCGALRNRYNLYFVEWLMDTYLIEGVGSKAGILPEYEIFESGSTLTCFSNTNCLCWEFVSNTEELAEENDFFEIYPNPSHSVFTITSTAQFTDAELFIANAVGQNVFEGILKETSTIDSSDWGSGVYFVVLQKEGVQSIKKIVKH